ncbi:hypothetical protein C0989_000616 [Termitomyces sp. Mn162]|nr:hypothetical protein C0989_000616 [Termitomyces sp. Mn162]
MKVILSESFQDTADMLRMLRRRIRVDQDIVQIYDDKDVVHVVKDVIHEVLEGGGGVSHSEGHYEILKEAVAGAKGGLPFMPWGNPDVVVAGTKVDFRVNLGAAKAINKVSD